MSPITVNAYAKINLVLDVLAKRPDGYHEINSIMQSVSLADRVTVSQERKGIVVSCDHPEVPSGPGNLAYRAARLLLGEAGIDSGVHIFLEKSIPVAAGLAGGSSDAAAVLLGINYLFNLGFTPAQLMAFGARLGADVPFCLLGGTAWARGIGEQLTLLPSPTVLWLVLVKPPFGVSTAQVYQWYDEARRLRRPDVQGVLTSLTCGDDKGLINSMGNVLEGVTSVKYPEVRQIIEDLHGLGSLRAVMCGSGPTVFGVARDENHARAMAHRLGRRYKETYVVRTL
ncbi:MAG: 4-(cytidine 5'-diphospho)-2-C-methyl-D-erythritol kinase [Bacillota bacterium]